MYLWQLLADFNLASPCCRAQVLADGIKGTVGKPLVEGLHNKLGGNVATNVVLESDVPGKVWYSPLLDRVIDYLDVPEKPADLPFAS